jgi:hypothetical protein
MTLKVLLHVTTYFFFCESTLQLITIQVRTRQHIYTHYFHASDTKSSHKKYGFILYFIFSYLRFFVLYFSQAPMYYLLGLTFIT